MKTRTNQPVFYDNGQRVDDSALGGTKLYKHELVFTNTTIYLISTQADKETGYTGGPPTTSILLFEKVVSVYSQNSGCLVVPMNFNGKIQINAVQFSGSTSVTMSGVVLGNFISDTVTPL